VSPDPLGIGIVGLGFMGRTHLEAWQAAAADGLPCRLTAVADPNAERRAGRIPALGNLELGAEDKALFDPAEVRGYETAAELFADPEVHLVSICTPTPSHVDLALAALAAGKHVLVEKPVDLDPARIHDLANAAEAAGRICMPAMCLRFWPGWDWLIEAVASGEFGAVRSASFRRLGTLPAWSSGFYADLERSGGALCDLHVHDVDMVLRLFGRPEEIQATGDLMHVTALYRYAEGPPHVSAEGSWAQAPGTPFRMRYVVNFEKATADYDIGRDEPLLLCREGRAEPLSLAGHTGYDGEVRHILGAARGEHPLAVTLADAALGAETLLRERRALTSEFGG
jgi:predicted dehydrogenase